MKCPICKTELLNVEKCPVCGFDDIRLEFVSQEDADSWMTNIVIPFKDRYESITNSRSYKKSDLLSYKELREFCFTSIFPYIQKELNNAITSYRAGSENIEDVHFYLTGTTRTIGVKVEIDAYPDIYNVATLFNDDRDNNVLATKMQSLGYEFAVAKIGIGASDLSRFARRIFLKNDGYLFNYKQLNFIKPKSESSNIRYSLSIVEPDESWKEIAGFDYKRPAKKENPNAVYTMGIQTSKPQRDYTEEIANSKFWKDEENARIAVNDFCKTHYVGNTVPESINQLIRFIAHLTMGVINLEEATCYTCNAIDYLQGWFLSDSIAIEPSKILIELKAISSKVQFPNKYELKCWEITAINYAIYLYFTDKLTLAKCMDGYYSATNPNDRPYKVVSDCMEKAFLDNPRNFGYGQNVIDEIDRLQNINSPKRLSEYESRKAKIEEEIRFFIEIHNKVISKKEVKFLGLTDKELLGTYSRNVWNFLNFIDKNFDEKLASEHKRKIDAFINIVKAYRRSVDQDETIIQRHLRGNYGFWDRREHLTSSKNRFMEFMSIYSQEV